VKYLIDALNNIGDNVSWRNPARDSNGKPTAKIGICALGRGLVVDSPARGTKGAAKIKNFVQKLMKSNTYQLYLQLININHMATFTSNLPDDLLNLLSEKAKALSLPKNKLMETALRLYLQHLEKAEYIKSYQQAAGDKDLLSMAEEGMEDYLNQIKE
jgi:hypothetical protein